MRYVQHFRTSQQRYTSQAIIQNGELDKKRQEPTEISTYTGLFDPLPLRPPLFVVIFPIRALAGIACLCATSEYLELALGALAGDALLLPQPPHLFQLCLQVTHRLVHEQLLERPLLDVARLVLLEMVDILHRAAEDCALGLLTRTIRNDAPKLVDPIVDVTAAAAFDFFL